MAYFDACWYCNAGDQSTTGYYAVTKWATGATIAAGALRRQNAAPAVNSERVFVAIVAGTTHATTEPTWVITRGAKTTDNTVTWQECTGASAVNGDLTNTPSWTGVTGGIATAITLGAIIKRNNAASYWICSTAGSTGTTEPAWANNTAGTTQTDSTVTWTCLGVVGNFTGGQAPHARINPACATNWYAPGNTIYVGDNHAESQTTTINIAPAASNTFVNRILCHNHSGSYPPASTDLTTGASISTTASASINFSPSPGTTYVYGLAFLAGVGGSNNAFVTLSPVNAFYNFEKCLFKLSTTFASVQVSLGSNAAGSIVWNNCTVYFGHVNQYIDVETTNFTWQNTGQVLAAGSLVPTGNGFINNIAAARLSNIVLEALDLSQLTGAVFGAGISECGNWIAKDCKLNASSSFVTPFFSGQTMQVVRSDSGATGYKSARYAYEGTETTETTITRVGGASDPTGQAQSRKIVTTANSQWLRPFKAEPYAQWNPRTGANVTVTVCGTINAGALPNNDDIWLEVEYLGSSASPLGTIVTTTKANVLAANAAVASDGSTWNGISATPAVFNSADLLNVTLSNGNLTATGTSQGAVRSTSSISSGKNYIEYTFGTLGNGNTGVGIGTAGANLANVGPSPFFAALVYKGGGIYIDNTLIANLGARSAADVIGVAVDSAAKLIWFRVAPSGNWNGSGTANPATGTGGLSTNVANLSGALFALASLGASGDGATANFGATSFTGAVPSGFTSGWPNLVSVWTSFKLTTTLSSPQPGMAGYLHARVRAAKPSTTYYLDPMVVLS